MIIIRQGMFETNSSSNHVFVFKPGNVAVTKTITFTPHSEDTMKNIYFNDYYEWYECDPKGFEDDMIEFLIDVLAIGVEEVKCSDKRIEELVEKIKTDERFARRRSSYVNKEAMKHILFDEDVKLTTLEDYDVCNETIERKFGREYNYYSIRLS